MLRVKLLLDDMRRYGVRMRWGTQQRQAVHGTAVLTETEERVAALVAEGLTNPQIGQKLSISRRTVQTHVALIFQKLGVSTRTELASRLLADRGR